MAFLFHWKRTKSLLSLIAIIILSNLGEATRYGAWIFSGIIFFVMITDQTFNDGSRSKKLFKTALIFISLSIFPFFWIIMNYQVTGELTSFLHSVTHGYSDKTEKWGILSEVKNNVLYYFFLINLLSLNILGLLNLLYFSKKGMKIKLYAFIFLTSLLSLSFITFFTKAMPTHNAWRLASIWSIMLLPFTAQWLYLLVSDKRVYLRANFILFILILLYYFTLQTGELSKTSYMTNEDLRIGNYIKSLEIENQNSKIYMERREWHFTSLLIGS